MRMRVTRYAYLTFHPLLIHYAYLSFHPLGHYCLRELFPQSDNDIKFEQTLSFPQKLPVYSNKI